MRGKATKKEVNGERTLGGIALEHAQKTINQYKMMQKQNKSKNKLKTQVGFTPW